jgi:cardiolipin-specific phospholipase
VTLDGPKRFLNQFSITATAPSPDAPPPTVVLHGYGAGLGFFFQNYPALGAWVGRRGAAMYALDWLGMGRSARVPFGVTAARADTDARVAQAEAFFVDALEEWRVRVGIERFQLVGHSLGGYLGCAYALRHPERVARLVLVSPAGIPHGPEGIVPSREVTESQDETINGPGGVGHSAAAGAQPAVEATRPAVERVRSEQEAQKRKETRTRRLLTYLWEEGWSPFQVVRSIGFWGPLIIGKVHKDVVVRDRAHGPRSTHRVASRASRRRTRTTCTTISSRSRSPRARASIVSVCLPWGSLYGPVC